MNDPDEIMYKLNMANWAYHIESDDGVYKNIIQDLDCLRISYRQIKLEDGTKINIDGGEKLSDHVFLPLSGMTVKLDENEAYYEIRQKRFYKLVRSENNERRRNKYSRKFIYQQFLYADPEMKDEEILHQSLGYRWCKDIKGGDMNKLPSMKQVFNGISKFLDDFLQKKLVKSPKKWQDQCYGRYKATLHYILDLVEYQNREKPITFEELNNPNSKAVCLILYLYSMDTPMTGLFSQVYNPDKPIYRTSETNMSDDKFLIRTLGPFDRCLQHILHSKCELNRFDRLESQNAIFASKSFLLYKGCFMPNDMIE